MKKTDLTVLEKNLDLNFKDKNLLRQAFIHRSFLNESGEINSNERLEFLGDSVLSLIVSKFLYNNYPNNPEGDLTNFRSSVVKSKTLSIIAQKIGLGDYLLLSKGEDAGGGRENPSLLADTLEALIGAIYLDLGITKVDEIAEKYLFPLLPEIIEKKEYKDYKSMLQEIIQEKTKISPIYKVQESSGPDHAKMFTIGVYVKDQLLSEGVGKSKQEGEQQAAKKALDNLPAV